MNALKGFVSTMSATWRGPGRVELGWLEEQGQSRACQGPQSQGGSLLLSQQSWAGFGSAGEVEHVVLGESRGTT